MKKRYLLPGNLCFFFSLIILFFIAGTILADKPAAAGFNKQQLNPDNYLPGVIALKVKAGLGPYEQQKSNVHFGISTLDGLVQRYSVSSLSKRFRHKPIPENSGLPDLSRIYTVEFPKAMNVPEVAAAFAADPNIEYAEPVYVYHASEIPDDPMYNNQQHLPQIMAAEAWDIHKGEDGTEEIVIAIIDTGVDWLHPDLTANTWQNLGEDADQDGVTLEYNNGVWERDPDDLNGIDDDNNGFIDDVIGWDFHESLTIGDGSNPDPTWGGVIYEHGSHCAGIAAGVTNNGVGISSVSYNVTYMPTQVDNGMDQFPYAYDAIIYAAENGADIISNSWGGPGYSQVGEETVAYAVGLGSIVVVAAHNYNTTQPYYPAAYPGAVSIAAVNANDTRASFTNYGIWIDLSAPGVGILSTLVNGNYASWSGTSMATPMVAGLFGLLKSYHPDWTNDELINQVIGTADDIDALNPGYENKLGDGRINAYHALVDENVVPQQELKLEFLSHTVEDENGNGMIEPEETVSINLEMKNWSQLVNSSDVSFNLSTIDPDINIISGTTTVFVPADAAFEIEDAFTFSVNEGATAHEAVFVVQVTADVEITYDSEFLLKVLVAPSGIFIWDGELNSPGYSGHFIKQYLNEQGFDVVYSDFYPHSFAGFDAVFLSFGNGGENTDQAIFFDYPYSLLMQEYLENGGKLYVEGMAIMGLPQYFAWENKTALHDLFGVTNASIGFISNPISSLEGQTGTLAEGILFTQSNQSQNWYIDQLTPAAGAQVPFVEDNFGNVSVYNEGTAGHKAFYLGYCLADLVDVDPHSSRYNVLLNMLDFMGYPQGDDYVQANFSQDKTDVLPGEEIQFTDFSVSAEGTSIESWAWDFDEDGNMDSNEQNPSWSYGAGGSYDIMLVVSNGVSADTLIRNDLVLVRSGILVFEGEENGLDQSGSFIRDHLLDMGYETVYTNHFPSTLDGFEAVFASFGSSFYTSPELTDEIANSLKTYGQQGGMIYLEGAQALGHDQAGNNLLWFVFGLEHVSNGSNNSLDLLEGQEGSIMEGLEFLSSSQFDVSDVDIFIPYPSATTAHVAFEESDYGAVAIQFDGADFYGQKTFCMSYSLADLEDGESPNTREELLNRILEFFNPATGTNEHEFLSGNSVRLYPNPASGNVTLAFELEEATAMQLELYNLSGSKVLSVSENLYPAGRNEIRLETEKLKAGTYFYRLVTPRETVSGKLIIVR